MIPNRLKRLSTLMMETISDVIRGQMKDPRIGFVSITGVDVTPDLKYAKVFVSVMGDQQQRDSAIAGLNNAAGFIHRQLSGQITIKRVPSLRFVLDDSIERGIKVCDLIRRAREQDEAVTGPEVDS